MCNRFAIEHPDRVELWSKEMLEWEWHEIVEYYNAAPTDALPIVHLDADGKPHGRLMKWGIRFPGDNRPYMNAKKERAFNLWKDPVQNRRCAVLADGFFEWPPDPQPKKPWMFRRKGHAPFAFAGVYLRGSSEELDTFAFLTTTPNGLTAAIGHSRSPVILDEQTVREWVKPGPLAKDQFERLTAPYPAEQMEMYRVTARMNRSQYKTADSVRPLSPEEIAAEDLPSKITAVERPGGEQLNLL